MSSLDVARKRIAELEAHILDIDAHATAYGAITGEADWVGTYIVSAGALHRALGKIGHTSPSCEAEARVRTLESELRRIAVLPCIRSRATTTLCPEASPDRDRWCRPCWSAWLLRQEVSA